MIKLDVQPAHGRYSLRPVVDQDFPFLMELRRQSIADYVQTIFGFEDSLAGEHVKQSMPGGHIVIVDGDDAGMLKATVRDGWAYLEDIYLLADYRGQGLGSQIIKDVLAAVDTLGLPTELQVFATNPAKNLYERLGFRVSHHKMYRPTPGT